MKWRYSRLVQLPSRSVYFAAAAALVDYLEAQGADTARIVTFSIQFRLFNDNKAHLTASAAKPEQSMSERMPRRLSSAK